MHRQKLTRISALTLIIRIPIFSEIVYTFMLWIQADAVNQLFLHAVRQFINILSRDWSKNCVSQIVPI